jgi:hypothetical protein
MKKTMKQGIAAVLLAFGIMSLTGCFYYHHDTDHVYRDHYPSYSYDHYWRDGYADNGPRHPDWNYD